CFDHGSSAQTVTGYSDLLSPVHLLLRFQECDISDCVTFYRAWRKERRRDSPIECCVITILNRVEWFGEYRCFGHSVQMIRHEHRKCLRSDSFADFAECGAQTNRIRPNQNSGMRTFSRMKKDRIADTVRRFGVDIGLDYIQFCAQCRTSSGAKTCC